MDDDALSRRIELLCAEADKLGQRDAAFLAPRLLHLMAAGHTLPATVRAEPGRAA
jgi:hypothetical protein